MSFCRCNFIKAHIYGSVNVYKHVITKNNVKYKNKCNYVYIRVKEFLLKNMSCTPFITLFSSGKPEVSN